MPKVCVEYDCNDGGTPGEPGPVSTYTTVVGDGSNTVFQVDHNLNTRDVYYTLRNTATGELDAYDVSALVVSDNRLQLTFATPPAASQVGVLVVGAHHLH